MRNFIFDLLFPKHCLSCNAEGFYICVNCLYTEIKENISPKCYLCGKRSLDHATCPDCLSKTYLDGIIIANEWENKILKQLIYEYKYRFIKDISKELSKTLIKSIDNSYFRLLNIDKAIGSAKDIITTFVPLHPKRELWRGFNQSFLLAKEVSSHFGWDLVNLLQRTKNTEPQAEIKKQDDRAKNITDAFALTTAPLLSFKSKTILIIDDICTTGATLEQCAITLAPLKPKAIWGLVLARG